MKCPYCGTGGASKNGLRVKGTKKVQRYLCKKCDKNFTPNAKPPGKAPSVGSCTVHGDRKIYALGLCQACYRKARRDQGKDQK